MGKDPQAIKRRTQSLLGQQLLLIDKETVWLDRLDNNIMNNAGTNEVWVEIDGFPQYEVSNLGNVRSWKAKGRTFAGETTKRDAEKPSVLVPTVNRGYKVVCIYRNGKKVTARIHHLVTTAFHGERPEGMVARHLNGDAFDNRAENLTWGTMSENSRDRFDHGTANLLPGRGFGTLPPALSDEEAVSVWERFEAGEDWKNIAKDFKGKCHPEVIRKITTGEKYAKRIAKAIEKRDAA